MMRMMTTSMRNLEIKARNVSLDALRKALKVLGATRSEVLEQSDSYFRVPKGRFKLRDERKRGAYAIFYERGEKTAQRFSTYHTLPVENPAEFRAFMASSLGMLVEVHKSRELWLYKNARIHLDEVEGLGTFLEIEVIVDRSDVQAKQLMDQLVVCFELNKKNYIKSSYSDLLLNVSPKKKRV